MRAILLLLSWAAGLAVYAGASWVLRGELLSLDNWILIGAVTLLLWAITAALILVPVLRQALRRRHPSPGEPALVGGMLAILPIWMNLGLWYGWHPRHLLRPEAAPLILLYCTSGAVLGLLLSRTGAPRAGTPRMKPHSSSLHTDQNPSSRTLER
jgi:hypothetical protein